jgi:hypothetical protein
MSRVPTGDSDDLLAQAWADFCDGLNEAGRLAFREQAPATPLDRAAGIQYLSRLIGKALNQRLEFNDPLHPELWLLQTPTSKYFGDNPDCTYLAGVVHGDHAYRLSGHRGTVTWVSFGAGGSALNDSQLRTEPDGSFEVALSAREQPGNWLQLQPGRPNRLLIRQFFGEWDTEEPMRLRIERVGGGGTPEPPTPEVVADGLRRAVAWLRRESEYWADWIDWYGQWPNEFVPGVPDWSATDAGIAVLNRAVNSCHWRLAPDEALVIDVRPPPRAAFWNFELNNYWLNSVDYRYRLSSVNSKQAALEPDGSVWVVVAREDPGVPNWLDTAGHPAGFVCQRWVDADRSPLPAARVVKLAELDGALPAGARRTTPAERREQLRRRKLGVERRFGFWA